MRTSETAGNIDTIDNPLAMELLRFWRGKKCDSICSEKTIQWSQLRSEIQHFRVLEVLEYVTKGRTSQTE